MSPDATTRVQISSTGFRNAGRDDKIRVTIGGVPVRVVSFQPGADPGEDHLIIEIPAALRGMGETDLICHVNGRVSNAVRIHLGS